MAPGHIESATTSRDAGTTTWRPTASGPWSAWTSTARWPRSSTTPSVAHIHPGAADALVGLAGRFLAVAVVTGRPARQVLVAGCSSTRSATRSAEAGGTAVRPGPVRQRALVDRRARGSGRPDPPRGLASLMTALPELLEGRGRSVTPTWRRRGSRSPYTPVGCPTRPARTNGSPRCSRKAARPARPGPRAGADGGRGPGAGNGQGSGGARAAEGAARRRDGVRRRRPRATCRPSRRSTDLRRGGMLGLLVCSGSEEQQALVEISDVVVDGPDGVVELLDASCAETPPLPGAEERVAAVGDPGEALERVVHRDVPATRPGPQRGQPDEGEHRQPEAGDVLPGVPLLVEKQSRAGGRGTPTGRGLITTFPTVNAGGSRGYGRAAEPVRRGSSLARPTARRQARSSAAASWRIGDDSSRLGWRTSCAHRETPA